jgi:hypothetical protein
VDLVTVAMIGGFILILLATLWNTLVAPKKKPLEPKGAVAAYANQQGFTASDATMVYDGVVKGHDVRLRGDPPSVEVHVNNGQGLHLVIEHGHEAPEDRKQGLIEVPTNRKDLKAWADYPLIAEQVLDDDTLKRIAKAPEAAYILGDSLLITAKQLGRWTMKDLVGLGADLAGAVEELNGVLIK